MDIKNIEKDLNYFGGGLLLYVNENMPRRALIAAQIDLNFDFFFPWNNMVDSKRLTNCLYEPSNQIILNHHQAILTSMGTQYIQGTQRMNSTEMINLLILDPLIMLIK